MPKLASVPSRMRLQGVRAVMEAAWKLPDAIHLEVGEPDFETPGHVIEEAVRAARGGYTKYTSNAGLPSLRRAIAAKMRRQNGLDVNEDWVVVTPGAVAAVASSFLALAEQGDEVLVPDPAWPNYVLWLRIQGAVPVPYRLRQEDDFLPRVEELERLVTPRTKCLVLNTPGNPTGAVFPRELLADLLVFARRHDLWVLSDEIYEDIVFEGEHVSIARFDTEGRVLTVSGLSKGYAMTGWRVGYVVATPTVASAVTRIQEPLTSCVAGMVQKAAEAALNGPREPVEAMRDAYRRRRDAALAALRRHGRYRYTPRGAFYVLVDISDTGLTSEAFAFALLEREHVAVAPGNAFGAAGEGLVRVSLASADEHVREGIERLCRFADELASGRRPVGAASPAASPSGGPAGSKG